MGINLKDLIPTKEIEMSYLSGRKLAIDAHNWMYQFLSIIRDRFTGEPLKDSKGNVTSHLSGLFYRTARLLENGIRPVYVFDGKPPDFKRETSEERRRIRGEAELKWKEALEAGDVEAVKRYSQQAVKLTPEMVEEAERLLNAMGISCMQAPSEGEAEATHMVKKGLVWASASQDWDSLAFGCPKLIRNLNITGKRKVPRKQTYVSVKPELVELDQVLKALGIGQDQLILLGILVGTDYNPGGVPGIGPKKALKLVKEQKTLDKVKKSVEWSFNASMESIFRFFKSPPVEDVEIEEVGLDTEELRKILVDDHDFSEDRIKPTLEKLKGKKSGHSGLGKFF